jgi:alginate O-acetyltransferase complex protein AlgI
MSAILSLWYLLATLGAALLYRLLAPRIGRTGRSALLAAISAGILWQFLSLSIYLPYLVLFAATIIGVASAMRGAHDRLKPWLLPLGVAAVTATMLAFKYPHFTTWVLGPVPSITAFSAIEWLGLSYFSFRAVDLLLVARSPLTKGFRAVDGIAYLLFFPPFVSGPINRFANFVKDMDHGPRPLERASLRMAAFRFSWGVVKVVALSRLAWYWSLPVLPLDLANIEPGRALLGLYAYFAYIYFEFSGYCDIVIVIGMLFGIRVPENFILPLTARNIQDFWNRWHISLSQWCRDHIFFPLMRILGLNLPGIPMLAVSSLSITATFVFIGVWHGDSINWVVYGLYHGLGLSIWMVWREGLACLPDSVMDRWDASNVVRGCSTFLTLNFVIWGLVLTLPAEQARQFLALLVKATSLS